MKRRPPSLDKPYPRHRTLSPDETDAWREAMGEKPPQEKRPVAAEASAQALHPAPNSKRSARASEPVTPTRHLDRLTLAKIRRDAMGIEMTLDLHGHNRQQAHAALLRFIARARENGSRLVLVITGKGRDGRGALREELPRWLDETPLREAIIAYDKAAPRHGGMGAWYLRIRKA